MPALGSPVFPLKASSNGRYVQDQNGQPFFMVGGSPQPLAHLSLADADYYLSTRASQGFNSVQIYSMPWNFGSYTPYAGGNGAYPFRSKLGGGTYSGTSGTADFSTPNDTYFAYLDQILDLATNYGFYIHLYAIDYGYGGDGKEGWWPDVRANSTTAHQTLGNYLGNRYKNRNNIVWVDGSDYNGWNEPSNDQKVVALVNSMQAAGAKQLRSGDWSAPTLSTDNVDFVNLMQLNGIYSYGGVYPNGSPNNTLTYPESRMGWKYVPIAASQGNPGSSTIPAALPAYLKETTYENSNFAPGTPPDVRNAQYWSVLSGGTAGLFYEHEAVVHLYSNWKASLTSTGAQDMKRMSALYQSFQWQKLIPSELSGMRRLVTSSNGSQSGTPANYAAAAQASDGTFMFVYVPTYSSGAQSVTVDFRSMAGNSRARWWDPTTGVYSDITGGAFSIANTVSAQSFTSPGSHSAGGNDWMLVLDTQIGADTTRPAAPTGLRIMN